MVVSSRSQPTSGLVALKLFPYLHLYIALKLFPYLSIKQAISKLAQVSCGVKEIAFAALATHVMCMMGKFGKSTMTSRVHLSITNSECGLILSL